MGSRFQECQVSQLVDAFKAAKSEKLGLSELVAVLRGTGDSVFTADEIEGIAATVQITSLPVEERPVLSAEANRGFFFVFEGLDRSGKSTQSKRLAEHFKKDTEVKWRCFPDRSTPSGALIDLYLRNQLEISDEAIHLLFSANRWEAAQAIVADLNAGISVVCDRYAFSGVAYSSAKGLDFTWCQEPDRGLPVPDAVFFLHIDASVGASRACFGDERYENSTMQTTVRSQFRVPELRAGVNWHDVDGARDMDVISAEIQEVVERARDAGRSLSVVPINRLWLQDSE